MDRIARQIAGKLYGPGPDRNPDLTELTARLRALADRWDTGEPAEREQCARELRAELPAEDDD